MNNNNGLKRSVDKSFYMEENRGRALVRVASWVSRVDKLQSLEVLSIYGLLSRYGNRPELLLNFCILLERVSQPVPFRFTFVLGKEHS